MEALRNRPVASRAQLQEDTGLSAASISRALAQMRRDGLVTEDPTPGTGVGRPPRIVRFQSSAAHVIGIDAGGSNIRVQLADLEGRPFARSTVRLRASKSSAAVLGRIAEVALGLVEQTGASPVAAAAGVSGIVDAAAGRVLLSPDLPGLNSVDVASSLSRRLQMPVAIDNDDLLAAAGEAAFGAAEGCTDVVFLSLGLGLGAGLLVGGRPVRGASSSAGAIAYFGPGRLDDRASGRAIPLRYAERAGKSPPRSAERVFELAEAGDEIARAVVDDVVEAFAELATDVGGLLDPQVIVLGGGIARGQPSLVKKVSRRIERSLPFPPRVVASQLGEDAVALGAASLALSLGQRRLAGAAPEPGRLGALEFA